MSCEIQYHHLPDVVDYRINLGPCGTSCLPPAPRSLVCGVSLGCIRVGRRRSGDQAIPRHPLRSNFFLVESTRHRVGRWVGGDGSGSSTHTVDAASMIPTSLPESHGAVRVRNAPAPALVRLASSWSDAIEIRNQSRGPDTTMTLESHEAPT